MIDLRYHIASIVAVFLALGLGVLIGSTIVGDDILVDQQQKVIDRLENEFDVLRERESNLLTENEYKTQIISNYENYSKALLPPLVRERLAGENLAIVVTGNEDIPAEMVNTLNLSGAKVTSKSIVLANMKLKDNELVQRIREFYALEEDTSPDVLRQYVAGSVAAVLTNKADKSVVDFLEESELVKFSGDYTSAVSGVIMVGGSSSLDNYFAPAFDQRLIEYLSNEGIKVFGVESSEVEYSYMAEYQKNNITTIDNIDLSPGQISLVFAIEGETGNYGIKKTAEKFMPSIPVEALGSGAR